MAKTLALIHTSMVFITVETMVQDILKEVLPGVRLINIVDDSLLSEVMRLGRITPEVTRRLCAYVVAAETAGRRERPLDVHHRLRFQVAQIASPQRFRRDIRPE